MYPAVERLRGASSPFWLIAVLEASKTISLVFAYCYNKLARTELKIALDGGPNSKGRKSSIVQHEIRELKLESVMDGF